MTDLETIRMIDKCGGDYTRAIAVMGRLSDKEFADFLRTAREHEEAWWNWIAWVDAVNLEVNLRLILKERGSSDGVTA